MKTCSFHAQENSSPGFSTSPLMMLFEIVGYMRWGLGGGIKSGKESKDGISKYSFKGRAIRNRTVGKHLPHYTPRATMPPYKGTWSLAGAQTVLKPIHTRVLSGLSRRCTRELSKDAGCNEMNFMLERSGGRHRERARAQGSADKEEAGETLPCARRLHRGVKRVSAPPVTGSGAVAGPAGGSAISPRPRRGRGEAPTTSGVRFPPPALRLPSKNAAPSGPPRLRPSRAAQPLAAPHGAMRAPYWPRRPLPGAPSSRPAPSRPA